MASLLSHLFSRNRPDSFNPEESLGAPGVAVIEGYIEDNEKSRDLQGQQKYRTYSDIIANTSIVAAGIRYFLNLAGRSRWSFTPSEHDVDGYYAELAEEAITWEPLTPWHRVVRRSVMSRFYGFSMQEWVAKRRDDGIIVFKDITPRAQKTIERWDIDESGEVLGVFQRSPQTQMELYLPRKKLLYVVDDTINDSPEGLGLLRHLALPAKRLQRYTELEGVGFEGDLRGTPIGYGPLNELAKRVAAGDMTKADAEKQMGVLRKFLSAPIRTDKKSLMLDSSVYRDVGEAERPTSVRKWTVELMQANARGLEEVAGAISRLNREMARVLGVEQLLLGEGAAGSFALSSDKTQSLFLLVDGALAESVDSVANDLLVRLWALNGWDEKFMPSVETEAIRFQDIAAITAALRDMAASGAMLSPDDPAVAEVYALLGLTPPEADFSGLLDAITGEDEPGAGSGDEEEQMERLNDEE